VVDQAHCGHCAALPPWNDAITAQPERPAVGPFRAAVTQAL